MLSLVMVIAFSMTSVTFTSCISDDSGIDQPQEGAYRVIAQKDLDTYLAYVIEYVSVAPDMKSNQVMSGVINLPKDPKSVLGIVLDNHYTIASNAECPSLAGGSDISKMIGGSFCVVSADYIGYGTTVNQLHPYLNHEVCARNSIDLARVAIDILTKSNVTGMKMVNLGYSQGAAVALAVHREIEKKGLAKELGFVGTWCGDGPYDVEATAKYYLANADAVSYPSGLALLVEGFLSSAPAELKGDLKYADFFSEKMIKAGLETWMRDRKLTTTEINQKMEAVVGGTLKMSDVFSPEMAVESGALMQKYLKFARSQNLCTGWTPAYPISLYHMVSDNVVPVVNTENAVKGLGIETVTYSELPLAHADFGPVYYGLALADIMLSLGIQM